VRSDVNRDLSDGVELEVLQMSLIPAPHGISPQRIDLKGYMVFSGVALLPVVPRRAARNEIKYKIITIKAPAINRGFLDDAGGG
jgi:hypothetical protein